MTRPDQPYDMQVTKGTLTPRPLPLHSPCRGVPQVIGGFLGSPVPPVSPAARTGPVASARPGGPPACPPVVPLLGWVVKHWWGSSSPCFPCFPCRARRVEPPGRGGT